jgi:hypothetical protein
MKKLELKHLAPYLPYDLNTQYTLSDVITLSQGQKDEIRNKLLTSQNVHFVLSFCRPILHPLSDLTKEIEHDGEKIKVIEIFAKDTQKDINEVVMLIENKAEDMSMDILPYYVIKILCEFHFDVFGLIPEGLAIDINSL